SLEEGPGPIGVVAASGRHQLSEGQEVLGVEGAGGRGLICPGCEAVAVVGDTVIAEALRVRGGRLGEQQVVEQVRAMDVEAEALGEIEQKAQLPVGLVVEE